ICVDYLSHEWKKEDDIWTSWKAMSKQKKEIANGIRLENASWRTWAKQKYHLRTVNPEKINWLKDNDVTWLYGPFHTEDEFHLMKASSQPLPPLSNSNNTDYVNYVNDIHSSPTSLVSPALSISSDPCTNSSTSSPQMFTSTDCETASTCSTISAPTTPIAGPTKSILLPIERESNQHNHHIRFNDQKIMKKKKDCFTICKIAPTKLKPGTIQPIPFCCSQSPPRIISSTSSSKNINDITQSEDQEEEEEEDNGLVDKAVNIATSVRVIVQWCSIMVFNR
ncbi:13326_t:CDS:2, partial [Entrophospora sp. SA101]